MEDLVPRSRGASVVGTRPGASGRPVIVIVGMHRSGTSFCSHMLGVIGVNMASEAGANVTNPSGHFERWEITELQDEVLALFQRAYYSPGHDFPLPPAWWSDFRLRPIKDRIKTLLAPFLERAEPFGFKDPRTARLMPLWHQVFAELGLTPRFVICLRDPAHVGISLQTRDSLDREAGEQRTLDYLVDALRYTRGRDRCFIRYDDWLREPMHNTMKLLDFVDPDLDVDVQDLEVAVQSVFREDLSRSGRAAGKARQPLVRSFYELVDRFAENDGNDAVLESKIDHFIQNYIAFRQLLRPFELQVSAAVVARTAAESQLAATLNDLAMERSTSAHLQQAHAEAVVKATQAEGAAADQAAWIAQLTASQASLELELSARRAEATEAARSATEHAQQVAAVQAARIDEHAAAADARAAVENQLATLLNDLAMERATSAHLQQAHVDAVTRATQAEGVAADHAARISELTGSREVAAAQAARIEELTAALAAADAERADLAEAERARLAEAERARLAEEERARLVEEERVRLAEAERVRLAEAERVRRRGLGARLFRRS